ncbi:cell division protein BolA [Idiomarina tyrosinivorans]|uniref:Cell division protein BolA n=1 Tax=Idiomarina tyrosinivorans TaxID=1445662 RepID=A0A432ZQD0_9GAMM|nr:BolA family protein [Idiomarina tyrosinivorans]RUO80107.1 cell division protein BolA [Idiomarina tyrosinivorans]
MEAKDIENVLRDALQLQEVRIKTDGSHAEIIAIDAQFEGLSRVKRQQLIYAPLNAFIADGSLHAVSIKTYTPEVWERDKKLMNLS